MNLVEGWTGRIRYQLVADGAATSLTGATIVLYAWDRGNSALTLLGTVGVETASEGRIYFDPNAADLTALRSPITVRVKVTDSGGKVTFYPNTGRAIWNVAQP